MEDRLTNHGGRHYEGYVGVANPEFSVLLTNHLL